MVTQDSDSTKSVTQDSDSTTSVTQDSDSTKLVTQDSDSTKSVTQDSDSTKLVTEDSDLTKSVTQNIVSDSGSIKKVPIKYLLVPEDAEERVVTSESANSAPMSLTLQKRLTYSKEHGDINMDLVISWDELFMGLALLEKKFINFNDKKPSSKVE